MRTLSGSKGREPGQKSTGTACASTRAQSRLRFCFVTFSFVAYYFARNESNMPSKGKGRRTGLRGSNCSERGAG